MNKQCFNSSCLLMTVFSIGALGIQTWRIPPAIASEATAPLSDLIFNLPEIPPEAGAPGNAIGGGSRSECVALNPTLTALVPKHEIYDESGIVLEQRHVWGHTLSAQPTLWFHLTEVDPDMTFEVRLKNGQEVHGFNVELPDAPGSFSFTLPDDGPTLMEGDRYRWEAIARIHCDDSSTESFKVNGWIVRVAPSTDISAELNDGTPQERIVLLAEKGIWFDALDELIDIYQPEQSAWEAAWQALIEPFELELEPSFPQR